jgi:hypothetical protein
VRLLEATTQFVSSAKRDGFPSWRLAVGQSLTMPRKRSQKTADINVSLEETRQYPGRQYPYKELGKFLTATAEREFVTSNDKPRIWPMLLNAKPIVRRESFVNNNRKR